MSKDIKLTITIDNKQDIELFEFANAMAALNNQYYSFLNAKNTKKSRNDQKLLIKILNLNFAGKCDNGLDRKCSSSIAVNNTLYI